MKFNHLPENADVMVQVCPRLAAASVVTNVTPWRKNPRASMVYMLVLGAGGDGGDGLNNGTTGGGGGGSGGQTSLLIPAMLLPDFLYVSTFANADSGLMGVFAHARATALALWRDACVAYANLGGSGSGATAGTAGAVATAANMPQGFGGVVIALAGHAGAAGGASAVGGSITYPTTGTLSTGGAGGGGAANNGGSITESAPRPGVQGAVTTFDSPRHSGVNHVLGALLPCGGAGGRGQSNATSAGGPGGTGGYGGGGGGGGSGGTSSTGGFGGVGGPGLIVIAQW